MDIEHILINVFDYDVVVKDIKMSIGVIKRILIKKKFDCDSYNCSIYNRVKTMFNIIEPSVMLDILQRELEGNFFHIKHAIIQCYEHKQRILDIQREKEILHDKLYCNI